MDDLGHILLNRAPVLENIYLVISILKNLFSLIIFVLLLSNSFIFIFIQFIGTHFWHPISHFVLALLKNQMENLKMKKWTNICHENVYQRKSEAAILKAGAMKLIAIIAIKSLLPYVPKKNQVPWRDGLVMEGSLRDLFHCKMELSLKMC